MDDKAHALVSLVKTFVVSLCLTAVISVFPNISTAFTNELEPGSFGPEVVELQTTLQSLGFYSYPEITGFFGPVTQASVQAFQISRNIVTTGTPQTTGFGREKGEKGDRDNKNQKFVS